jgi:uncharacterized cupin superfamily protein
MTREAISMTGRGARGESFADILRRIGLYGVLPDDSDAEALAKFTTSVGEDAADGIADLLEALGTVQIVTPVKAAATSNITLSGAQTIDGIPVVATDRVGVFGQTSGAENGIYVVAAGAWTRATDFDQTAEVLHGSSVLVQQGSNAGSWLLTTADPITVGTTVQTWEQYRTSAPDYRNLSSITVTVGTGGDYDHIQEALDYLSNQYLASRIGLTATVNLVSGFTMTEQVLVENVDLSWVEITSADATVTIAGSSMTSTKPLGGVSTKYCFAALNAGMPIISVLFAFDDTGVVDDVIGLAYEKTSWGTVSSACGVNGATGYGLLIYNGSAVYAEGAQFTGGGNFGALVEGSATLSAQSIDLSANNGGIRISQGSQAHIANAILSDQIGSNGDGLLITQGCHVNAQISVANDCSQSGFRGRGASILNVTGGTSTGCQVAAIYAEKGFTVNAAQQGGADPYFTASRASVGSEPGILAKTGGKIYMRGAQVTDCDLEARGTGSFIDAPASTINYTITDNAGAVSVLEGGQINITSSTVSCSGNAIPAINGTSGGKIIGGSAVVTQTNNGIAMKLDEGAEFVGKSATITGDVGKSCITVANGAHLNAPSLAFTAQSGQNGITIATGGKATLPNSTCTDVGTPSANRVSVSGGGIVTAASTTWTCNLTDNTPSAGGLILR